MRFLLLLALTCLLTSLIQAKQPNIIVWNMVRLAECLLPLLHEDSAKAVELIVAFDLPRVMQTDYRIDDFQQTYFVIDSFEQLLSESYKDFKPIYRALAGAETYLPDTVLERDRVLSRGTQSYAKENAAS